MTPRSKPSRGRKQLGEGECLGNGFLPFVVEVVVVVCQMLSSCVLVWVFGMGGLFCLVCLFGLLLLLLCICLLHSCSPLLCCLVVLSVFPVLFVCLLG